MSAFVVNESHIDVLMQFATRFRAYRGSNYYYWNGESHKITRDNVSELGQKLLDENYKSVNYRYNDNEIPDKYVYKVPSRTYTPVEILKACACLNYQSCEHPEWEESEAYAILETIKSDAINALPGYEEANWEITDQARYPSPNYKIVSSPVIKGRMHVSRDGVPVKGDSSFWSLFNAAISDAIKLGVNYAVIEWELEPINK